MLESVLRILLDSKRFQDVWDTETCERAQSARVEVIEFEMRNLPPYMKGELERILDSVQELASDISMWDKNASYHREKE